MKERLSRLRTRLAKLERATEDALTFSDERREQVLKARARALSAPARALETAQEAETAIRFRLASERFALPMSCVREVAHVPPLTRLPGVPSFVSGVVAFRGEIVCVYDLFELLGVAPSEASVRRRLLALGRDRTEAAVLVDEAEDQVQIDVSTLHDAHAIDSAARQYVRGVTPDATVLLDGASLLDDPRLIVDHRADSEGP